MNKQAAILITIAAYVILMVATGIIASRKSKSIASFTVGKRNAGAWLTALSYGTAYFSAVMFVGYSGSSGWDFGLWSILIGIGNAVIGSLIAWMVLASRTRAVSHKYHIKSMPQFFNIRYQSKAMLTFTAIITFIFLLPYSASVYKGLTYVCSILLEVDPTICMIIIAAISALLLITGGYGATIKADFIQGVIMMVGIAFLVFYIVKSPVVISAGGVSGMWGYMENNQLQPMPASKWVSLISTVLMTSFGTWGLPQMIHKFYGIKDDHEIKRGITISTFFALLVGGGGYFIGSFSHLYFNVLPEGGKDAIIPNMLNMSSLPVLLLGVVLVLLISASVSTLSSITLTACTTVTIDLVKPRLHKTHSEKHMTGLIKMFCLLFVILSYVVANTDTPILDMMSYSWGILSGSFLAPYLLALYWKGMNRLGAWAGMIGGFVIAMLPATSKAITIINPDISGGFGDMVYKLSSFGPLFAVIAMAVSFLLCFIGSKAKTKSTEINVDEFYKAIDDRKTQATVN